MPVVGTWSEGPSAAIGAFRNVDRRGESLARMTCRTRIVGRAKRSSSQTAVNCVRALGHDNDAEEAKEVGVE